MADWIGVGSSHYDSHCGDDGARTIEEALDGTDYWLHEVNETHWFVLNLGQTYNITKVRGRSDYPILTRDPDDVNIYVSDDKANWGTAVASGITTWQDTTAWVEVDVTDKNGRYVKVEIVSTESADNYLRFGDSPGPFTIFDVYGEVPAGGAEVAVFMGTEL